MFETTIPGHRRLVAAILPNKRSSRRQMLTVAHPSTESRQGRSQHVKGSYNVATII